MLDFHCHIIPGVDDGSKDLDMSLAMLEAAKSIGIDKIVATPHAKHDPVDWDAIHRSFDQLVPYAEARGITLYLGCELYAPLLNKISLDAVRDFCIEGTNRVLIEFHPDQVPPNPAAYMNELRARDVVPILAHPERYTLVQENPGILRDLVEIGCFLQVNGKSFSKNPFDRLSNTAKRILKLYPSAFLSSDAHRPDQYASFFWAEEKYHRARTVLP